MFKLNKLLRGKPQLFQNADNQLFSLAIVTVLALAGSPAFAGDPDASLGDSIVTFTTSSNKHSKKATCVGFLVSPDWMMTAAHCIEPDSESITVHCSQRNKNSPRIFRMQIGDTHRHAQHDIAVLRLEKSVSCRSSVSSAENSIAIHGLVSDNSVAESLFIVALADGARTGLSILDVNAQNYIVNDTQCLTQGDSGTPVFTYDNSGRTKLAAVLISGTSDCPALQILANVSDVSNWVRAILAGDL